MRDILSDVRCCYKIHRCLMREACSELIRNRDCLLESHPRLVISLTNLMSFDLQMKLTWCLFFYS